MYNFDTTSISRESHLQEFIRTALAFHRRVRGGEVSKLIPHPLSLVVNVNFYSCLQTIINPTLSDGTIITLLSSTYSTKIHPTRVNSYRRVKCRQRRVYNSFQTRIKFHIQLPPSAELL